MDEVPTATSIHLQLICANCGAAFESVERPLMRCPACQQVGNPDRVGRHFLASGWVCKQCGESNDGLTNFCLSCGTGLASRCLRCEGPVYKATCDQCGAHQERARRYASAEQRRATWIPILHAHIQEERLRMEGERAGPSPMVREWRALDTATSTRLTTRPTRQLPSRWRTRWGLALVSGGGVLLLLSYQEAVAARLALAGMTPDRLRLVSEAADEWLRTFAGRFQAVTPADQEYALLFGAGLLMLSLLPLLLFLAGRLAKRLFP